MKTSGIFSAALFFIILLLFVPIVSASGKTPDDISGTGDNSEGGFIIKPVREDVKIRTTSPSPGSAGGVKVTLEPVLDPDAEIK